jgi:hypothetical protein
MAWAVSMSCSLGVKIRPQICTTLLIWPLWTAHSGVLKIRADFDFCHSAESGTGPWNQTRGGLAIPLLNGKLMTGRRAAKWAPRSRNVALDSDPHVVILVANERHVLVEGGVYLLTI